MRRHKARFDVKATGPRRMALSLKQHGDGEVARCGSPWCGRRWLPVEGGLQEAHADNVKMGRSRHDQENPVNDESNRMMLCPPCHLRFGREPLARRLELYAEWKAWFECQPGHGVARLGVWENR